MVVKGNKKELDPDVCEGNPDIVIAANYLDRNPACAGVPLLIDKAYLKYNGAVALRFVNGTAQIETAKQFRGDRPWVVLWREKTAQTVSD